MRSVSIFSAGLFLAVACGGASSSDPTADPATSQPAAASSPAPGATSAPSPAPSSSSSPPVAKTRTVFTMVFENHDYAEIIGSTNAPYFNKLAQDYALATNYADSGVHPSLPNYLTMASGAAQYPGIVDLDPTSYPFPVDKPNLGSQLEAAKIPWRSYQEHMGTPCKLAVDGTYAPKHDPFLYFVDMQKKTPGLCEAKNVDYAGFAADLAAGTYRFMWITPDLTDDGHDPPKDPVTALQTSDAWASREIPKILASPAFQDGGVLFVTWDEAEGRSGTGSKDKIPMIVVSNDVKTKGYKSTVAYSHKSWLATVEDLLGLPRLATVTNEPSMTEMLK